MSDVGRMSVVGCRMSGVVVVVVLDTCSRSLDVYVNKRLRINCATCGRTPGSQDSWRPRHLPALDDKELFVIEGSKKCAPARRPQDRCGKRKSDAYASLLRALTASTPCR